ncbi:MAG TPA: signal peptidase I [Terriglobales bacterium]|nr:signal peptidase I [Terriglobales bacterium]
MAAKEKDKKEEIQEEKPKETPVEFLASLASVLVTGLFIITFILQAFEIPSSSMVKTLLIGDHVFVNRIQFAPKTGWMGPLLPYRQIHRGDIFVFLSPMTPGLYVVKRVMGIPGDHIHLRDGVVYRNGEKLDEPYVNHDASVASLDDPDRRSYRLNFPAVMPTYADQLADYWQLSLRQYIQGDDIVVPPDSYFAMGDNRDVSYDSRYWGFVPQQNVVGRPMFIYWSFDTPEGDYQQKEITARAVGFLHVVLHFFDKTRWSRTLKVVR